VVQQLVCSNDELVTVSIPDVGYYRDILAVDLLSCNMFTTGTDGEYRYIKHHFIASSVLLTSTNDPL